eukprot:Nitzschia sp. Nitz4//scaffold154_size52827//16137//18633//NITZ4_006774-RA/size52827-augustus-gene-0.22-mRNA-1//-1//CDS//3329537302//8191//frame0
MSAPRRQSVGGALAGETPIRDRRAMLEAWRQQRADNRSNENTEPKKRARHDPPLPPSGVTTTSRMFPSSQESQPFSQPSPSSSIAYYDDEAENQSRGSSLLTSRTPLGRRGKLGSARRHSLLGRNVGHLNSEDVSQSEPLSQLSMDLDTSRVETVDAVEGAGLMSQMERMKRRLEELEKEKMDLSMSKAPLEARFRQKEDLWLKEKTRMMQEIESSKQSLREADEKFRDLQVQYDQAYDECIHLRQEVRKVSSSRNTTSDNSLWSRQLQNDRDLVEVKDKLRAAEEEINSTRLAKASLEKELHGTRIELKCIERNYDELKAEYDEISAHTSENNEAEIKLQVLTEEHMATSAALNAVYADLDATKARAEAAMNEKEEAHKEEIEKLQFELSVMKTRASKVQQDAESSQMNEDVEDDAVLRAEIEKRDKKISDLEGRLLELEQLRRQMHNQIQELRGNIRVFVRTRPFLPGDQQNNDSPVTVSPDGENLSIVDRRSGSPLGFKFDKVFAPSAGQELVFDEVSDFVQSALDGYHVCLFSYGQTGSGKTHTMQGCGNGPMRGIIPRAVEKILDQARALNHQKWNFTLSASFLEIYNENLRDLLAGKGNANEKLAIKRDRDGKSFVAGLTSVPINALDAGVGMQQLADLMSLAARSRSVASTKMNSQSSRSHSVFMLHLNGYNEDSGAIVNGALNLCDLAGSERLDRSGAGTDAQRLKETQSINKSLSCLGDVFNALATGAPHVPYRNSKLTYLLQDCLSGDGKALMFVNLSPTSASSGESLCSLRFAQRVNQVELGKATKHIQYSGSQ